MTIHVNGVALYYEKAGAGPPLLLLHGNGESHRIFHGAVARLAEKFTVYAVDSRGHGKSARVRELHYADMAEDIARFIAALGLERPMLYGFSDGGIVGLQLAAERPGLLSRLAVSGASLNPNSTSRGWLRFFRAAYALTRGARWKLMLEEPDFTAERLARIDAPTLVLAGERDMILEAHTRAIAGAVPGARLRILPGENHMSYVFDGEKLCREILPFFEGGI
ncbi:MAG: alpha/beta hydrolase [Oscillospiraceae bacterium]|jgi:pimeloyl-ACP methyl ester carboxylesterase|nr:alpha/beta hydrolase [Oscillospiraceae bacterium]